MQKKDKVNFIISIVTASVALISFLALMVLILNDYSFKIDKFNVFIANNRNAGLTKFFKIFTHLGSFYTLAILTIIAICLLFFVMKNKRFAIFSAVCFGAVCVSNFLIKVIVKRMRPEHLMIIKETGYSFPSGHAMMTFAFFALAICFAYKFVKNKPLKITLISIFSVLIVAISFSRIYLGVHYLTDIVAGWLITFVIVVIFIGLYNTKFINKLTDANKK